MHTVETITDIITATIKTRSDSIAVHNNMHFCDSTVNSDIVVSFHHKVAVKWNCEFLGASRSNIQR
jgi:hypothetical protein